jgi:hypothetical protein
MGEAAKIGSSFTEVAEGVNVIIMYDLTQKSLPVTIKNT